MFDVRTPRHQVSASIEIELTMGVYIGDACCCDINIAVSSWRHDLASLCMGQCYYVSAADAAADDDDVDRVLFDALRSVAPFCWPTMLSI